MGTAGSSNNYKTHAQSEAERVKREELAKLRLARKREEQEKRRAENAAREAWLKHYRAGMGYPQKTWWNSEWWPLYSWWKERQAWKKEKHRRWLEGYHEGELLRPHQE
jgi:hypothetical protein